MRQSGFTLIELIAVMIIAVILAAIIAPRFFERDVFESRGFRDQVISALRYAQKAAIAQHGRVCVAFTANSVTLTTGATTCNTNLTGPDGAAPYRVESSRVAFVQVPADFSFDALGRPSTGHQTIQVMGAAVIVIEAETGYVH